MLLNGRFYHIGNYTKFFRLQKFHGHRMPKRMSPFYIGIYFKSKVQPGNTLLINQFYANIRAGCQNLHHFTNKGIYNNFYLLPKTGDTDKNKTETINSCRTGLKNYMEMLLYLQNILEHFTKC